VSRDVNREVPREVIRDVARESGAFDVERRNLLLSAAGLAIGGAALSALQPAAFAAEPAPSAASAASPASAASAKQPTPGKPGDFDFLTGEWRISPRRLKNPGDKTKLPDWDEYDGAATCWGVLAGVGSIEELRIPARNFSGMGIRLLDVEKRVWNDFWINSRSGVLAPPGLTGSFEDGVGTFTADDVDGDQAIIVRGVWDRITPKSCRWHQAVSRDGGKTWEGNWFMDWRKV
jgi:hypothetical protein